MMEEAILKILSLVNKYRPVIEGLFGLVQDIQKIMSDDSLDENEKLARIDAIVAREDAEFDRRVAEAKARLEANE